ncbi:MAG: PmoA family protein [Phycisphaerae bacterium]|nr:PmoA family protein [Saprospiraceae bacterium]
MKKHFAIATIATLLLMGGAFTLIKQPDEQRIEVNTSLVIRQDKGDSTLSVCRSGENNPLVVQNARANFRPYLHPIAAPDGKGVLTEYSPGHHKHQTGLYWGFTRVNGRDYFHHPEAEYWQRVAVNVLEAKGAEVKWQTVYNMLGEKGETLMTETQTWSARESEGKFFLTLEWRGEAKTEVTIGKYDYGGLFLRMPWKEGINGEVVNAARQKNNKAEGQRAMWVDVAMQVEGRDDFAHVAIFDHPENKGYPQPWRVDNQLGVGPARAREADWQIKKGETEVIRHQLVVYTGTLNDVDLTKTWSAFSGAEGDYNTAVLWNIAKEEAKQSKFLKPDEAVAAMTVKDGFNVNVWASEPMMTQPMAFCWDDRGRLWIAENKDYESRGHGFSNSGKSRILILEDTDKDGVADKKKIFIEGIAFPAALAVGFDGVFVGAPPNLLFVPDRNRDDIADESDIEVRLTGWGIRDRHETLNSLHWGPDGWLYGCQGFATPSKVRKPVGKGKLYKHNDPFPEDILRGEGVDINGGVWRYHPIKDRFEVVAHGFSNPWGIDYDANGQLFISACVIPHMWHVIPGGIYHRQGGQHFNPYVYNDIKTITDHSHRSAHGGARIYQSDAFPKEHNGRIFMANIHEHAVLSDVLQPEGSGFVAHHGDDFMLANNGQWVGFSMEIGPDGALYVLDWHDADICGQEVLNSETGRIYRIAPKETLAENFKNRNADLTMLSDQQLVELQLSTSDWHARRARNILQHRAAKGTLKKKTHSELKKIYQTSTSTSLRLRALWALHMTNGLSSDDLQQGLNDQQEQIRAWSIQFLCEDKNPSAEAQTKFVLMAQNERSAMVRLYLASALQRVDKETAWKVSGALMQHGEDKADHNLPMMIWFGFENLVSENPTRALDVASQAKIPLLAQYAARRAVDADALEVLVTAIGDDSPMKVSLLEGMLSGMEGRNDLKAPGSWKNVLSSLQRSTVTKQLSTNVDELFGDTESAQRAWTTLKNTASPVEQRRKALQALTAQQNKDLVKGLPELLHDADLRIDAIRSMAAFDDDALGKLLLKKYDSFSPAEKQEAILTLSSRPHYGWLLTQSLKNNTVPKRDVQANVARQLRRVVGSGFVEVWGPIDEVPHDAKAYAKYKTMLSDQVMSKVSVKEGKVLFQRSCGACHKLFGQGGNLGPDLTGSNRSNIDYLLLNILEPSAEIQDDYRLVVLTTRDGRTYSGNIIAENQRQITLRVVGQDAIVINKSTIQSREVTPTSMMPPGLLEPLTDAEVVNLVAYLRSPMDVK